MWHAHGAGGGGEWEALNLSRASYWSSISIVAAESSLSATSRWMLPAAGVPRLLGSGDLSGSPAGEAAASEDALSELLSFLPTEFELAWLDAAASIFAASPP